MKYIFATDFHGKQKKYNVFFQEIIKNAPDGVFLGGDLLPLKPPKNMTMEEFIEKHIFDKIRECKKNCKNRIKFFLIMGNDDPRIYEKVFKKAHNDGLIEYVNEKTVRHNGLYITGYSFVPPTPFRLKDWEKYDVSRHVDVGAISPEEGKRTVSISSDKKRYSTIKKDLEKISQNSPLDKTIFLFHSPPYQTYLDRADLDGKKVDHAPVDVHVGSIAIKRFIKKKQPLLTLHGHVHESTDMTGRWKQRIGDAFSFNGACKKSKACFIMFDTDDIKDAKRVEKAL
ncbi:MAG: metallophosphoesterase [Candidatus Thermoplasmatota archaeon]